jgi:nitrite reductase/ring-hydroxylating ferredoxin subunit
MMLDLTAGNDSASSFLIGIGIAAALPTAAAGLSDWLDTEDAEMRVGMVHAIGNALGLALLSASWIQRRREDRGLVASVAGMAVMGLSGWLGGHLSYALGVGVDTNAFSTGPEEWTAARLLGDAENLQCREAEGVRVAVAHLAGRPYGLVDRCSHRGGPLSEGSLVSNCIECPWHKSRFDLRTGLVERGPASVPQPGYEVRDVEGLVEVRRKERRALRRNPV